MLISLYNNQFELNMEYQERLQKLEQYLQFQIEQILNDPVLNAMKQNNITKGFFGDRLLEMIKEIIEDEKEITIK